MTNLHFVADMFTLSIELLNKNYFSLRYFVTFVCLAAVRTW